jgi:hypothetical protein
MSFFKNEGQVGKTGPVWGLVPVGRANMAEILCTEERKWNNETY